MTLFAALLQAKEIYKYHSPEGRVLYCDVPLPGFQKRTPEAERLLPRLQEALRQRVLQFRQKDLLLRRRYGDEEGLEEAIAEERRGLTRQLELLKKSLEAQRKMRELYRERPEAVAQIEEVISEIERQIEELKGKLAEVGRSWEVARARRLFSSPYPLPDPERPFPRAALVLPCRAACSELWQRLSLRLQERSGLPLYLEVPDLLYSYDPTRKAPVAFGLLRLEGWLLVEIRCAFELPDCRPLLRSLFGK